MATTFGGVPLKGRDGAASSGAAFELNPAPKTDGILLLTSGWEVEVQSGLPYAIARTAHGLPLQEALDGAIDATQQALDLLCVAEHQRIQVQNYEREHLVWYTDGGTNVLQALTISGLGMHVSTSVKITHEDGTAEEPDLYPIPTWHECFRYYRLAQVTEDPFDAFRNLWLSLELALSLKSAKGAGERETDWLRRVGSSLQGTLPATAWPTSGANQVDDLVQDYYVDTRCRLFHAKDGKSRLNPHVANDRRLVVERFAAIQPFVREVLADIAGAPRGGGVVTYQGFRTLMEQAHGDGLVLLSASSDALNSDETTESACWSDARVAPGPRMAAESHPGLELRGVRQPVQDLLPLKVCRIGLASKDENGAPAILHTSSLRSAMLDLDDDFDEFEPVCGVELVNQSSPRARFRL